MTVQEMVLQNNGGESMISTRTLGLIGMFLSPMLFFASLFYGAMDQPSPYPLITSLGGILYLGGAMASAVALRRLRVTGSGKGAKVLFIVQIIGLLTAMCFDALEYAAPHLRDRSWLYFITDLAYPFSHVLMIVVGAAVARAKIWRGWRRIPAFLVGFALPSFIALSIAFGRENAGFVFPLMVTTGFFTLGLAIFTTKTAE
jgi:hypothetical protein